MVGTFLTCARVSLFASYEPASQGWWSRWVFKQLWWQFIYKCLCA